MGVGVGVGGGTSVIVAAAVGDGVGAGVGNSASVGGGGGTSVIVAAAVGDGVGAGVGNSASVGVGSGVTVVSTVISTCTDESGGLVAAGSASLALALGAADSNLSAPPSAASRQDVISNSIAEATKSETLCMGIECATRTTM